MIVIDVGCASYEGARSIPNLLLRFRPDRLLAYDPKGDEVRIRSKVVERIHAAAWRYDGTIGFHEDSTSSYVSETDTNWPQVPCVDLARVIDELDGDIVLKLDCEGAEYALLSYLHERGLDKKLTLCLVEWHDARRVELDCPVEDW